MEPGAAPEVAPSEITRWVDQRGGISLVRHRYKEGAHLIGEHVEVVVAGGLVEICHHGVVAAAHVQKGQATLERSGPAPGALSSSPARPGPSVTRMADANGCVYFAGSQYRAVRMWARRPVTVTLVAGSVHNKVVRVHPPATTAPQNTGRSPPPTADPGAAPGWLRVKQARTSTVKEVPGLDN